MKNRSIRAPMMMASAFFFSLATPADAAQETGGRVVYIDAMVVFASNS